MKKKWTKEKVIDSAKKFKNRKEWRESGDAYAVALKNKWIDEATSHMERLQRKKWEFDEVLLEAQKFESVKQWRTDSPGSYSAASKRGWLKDLTITMSRAIKSNGYWTKKRVIEDAAKYISRSEWMLKSSGAASMAKRNGWYDEATKNMTLLVEHGKWTKQNVLIEAKKYQTLSEWGKAKNVSYSRAIKNGWIAEASMHMSFPDKTRKWTKSNVLEDASKYTTLGEWHKADGNAAHVAIKKGWLEEATTHMHRTYSFGEMTIYKLLTQLDVVFETQKRFASIKSKKPLPFDFYLPTFNLVIEYQGHQHFFESSRKRSESLETIQYRDELKRIGAEKLKFNYLAINQTSAKDIEKILVENLKKISNIENQKIYLVKRELTEFEMALVKSLGKITKEQVIADARKYPSFSEWRKKSPRYQIAIKNGWLEECKEHMISEFQSRSEAKLIWSKDKVISDALKHQTRTSWKTANGPAYQAARKRGWLEEATAHMTRLIKPNGYWTKEKIFNSAIKFKTRKAWATSADKTAYTKALENGWLDDACAHMTWASKKPQIKA